MHKPPDPFDILIALRDRLAPRADSARPLIPETPSERYESARRSFQEHARRRTPGEVVAASLLPPIDELPASEYGGLGREAPACWSGSTARIPLELSNAHERELRIAPKVVGDASVSATLCRNEAIPPGGRVRLALALRTDDAPPTAPFRIDLCEGGELYARLHVTPADQPAPGPIPVRLHAGDDLVISALRGLQRLVLDQPVAARRIFGALVAEGRAFAKTARGREWSDRLRDSELLRQARLVVQMSSLSMLEHCDEPDALPSAYLEALFAASSSEETDELLDRLFGEVSP